MGQGNWIFLGVTCLSTTAGPPQALPLQAAVLEGYCPNSTHRCHCAFSVTKSHPTCCNPMDCSSRGFPVLHYLSELAQALSQWCHPTISSSVTPFSSCPQYFPASKSFPMSQLLHIRWPKYWSNSFSVSLSQWILRGNFLYDWHMP